MDCGSILHAGIVFPFLFCFLPLPFLTISPSSWSTWIPLQRAILVWLGSSLLGLGHGTKSRALGFGSMWPPPRSQPRAAVWLRCSYAGDLAVDEFSPADLSPQDCGKHVALQMGKTRQSFF